MQVFTSIRALWLALFLALALGISGPQAHAADPEIEAAQTAGIVGETVEGYLGFVTASNDAALQRKVNEINAKRRALYERLSRETGTTIEQVGAVTAQKQIEKLPAGQFYMNETGRWVRK